MTCQAGRCERRATHALLWWDGKMLPLCANHFDDMKEDI